MAQFPLVISADGRWLEYSDGGSFLANGDSVWSIMVEPTLAEVQTYLDDRQAKGVNLLIAMAIAFQQSSHTPRWLNANGDAPFTDTLTGGELDFTTPNEAYWAHVDAVLAEAGARGMVVVLFPAYYNHNSQWGPVMVANGVSGCTAYGTFLGNRYKDTPNIIWGMGGDSPPTDGSTYDFTAETNALANAIIATGDTHLITAKSERGRSSFDDFGESWLTVNANYAESNRVSTEAREAWQQAVMPTFLIEGIFGNEHGIDDLGLRTQMWQAIISGGFGHIYGNSPQWYFGKDDTHPLDATFPDVHGLDWRANLNNLGAQYLPHVAALQTAVDLAQLVPDYDHEVLISGNFLETDVFTPATANARNLVAYTRGVALGVDLSKFDDGLYQASWLNPRTGATVGIQTFGAGSLAGVKSFSTPDSEDWVLRLSFVSLEKPIQAVYEEPFTTEADRELSAFNADWQQLLGSPDVLQVTASRNRLEAPDTASGTALLYTWTGAMAPTGEQHVRALCHVVAAGEDIGVAARMSAGANGYVGLVSPSNNDFRIFRVSNGSYSLLASGGVAVVDTTYEVILHVSGTNPVLLQLEVMGQGVVASAQDSTVDRKETGTPGIHFFAINTVGDLSQTWMDDFQVYELSGTGSPPISGEDGGLLNVTSILDSLY